MMTHSYTIVGREREILEELAAETQTLMDRFQHTINFIAKREGLENAVFDGEAWVLAVHEQEGD